MTVMRSTQKVVLLFLYLAVMTSACDINRGIDFMSLQTTPDSSSVVEGIGLSAEMNLGWFNAPFADPNVTDALGFPPAENNGHLRQKKWHFLSFAGSRYIIGIAAVDATYIANGFVYIYDYQADILKEFSHVALPDRVIISNNSISGESIYDAEDFYLRIANHGYRHTVTFNCRDDQNSLSGTLQADEAGDPFVQAKEVEWRAIVYTHQNSQASASGTAVWNGQPITFNPETDYAGMDYTAAVQKHETFWNWASGTGYATDGTPLAVNLGSDPVFWIGSTIYRVEDVTFDYQDLLSEWTIRSGDGTVDLIFHPVNMREGNINFLNILKSEFYQPFGSFSGTITGKDGTVYEIDTMPGVTEEHYARW